MACVCVHSQVGQQAEQQNVHGQVVCGQAHSPQACRTRGAGTRQGAWLILFFMHVRQVLSPSMHVMYVCMVCRCTVRVHDIGYICGMGYRDMQSMHNALVVCSWTRCCIDTAHVNIVIPSFAAV